MKPGIPWSVKGIEPEMREAAKDAARRSGMTLGEWLNTMILEQADDAPPQAPSVRMDRPQRAADSYDDTTIRLEDIAEQLSRIARREQDTANPRPSYAASTRDADQDTLARILNRVESNERQTVEAFSAVNERLTVVGRQIAQVGKAATATPAEETAGYQALEKAMRNIVEHLEVSEHRTRDNLKTMQDRMSEMSQKAANAPSAQVLQSAPAFTQLEQRLSDLTVRLERSENKSNQGLPDIVRQELSSLADRIETVRETSENLAAQAQTQAVQTSQSELRAIEQRILTLLQEAQSTFNSQNITPAEMQRIRSEIENLNQRIDGAHEGVASNHDVHALRVVVEQLSSRMAQGPDMRPLADMDRKLVDISQRLEQTQASTRNMPQFGELERRMVELDHRLNEAMRLQGDGKAQLALEQKIAEVSDRMARAEHQLGHLETIERAINQLFDSIEQQRVTAKDLAEEAAGRMAQNFMAAQPAVASFNESPEYHALQDGLRVVRESANNADQRNQETLEAVHETLEQIVLKLGELETAAVGHQVATAIQQPYNAAPEPQQNWQAAPVEPAYEAPVQASHALHRAETPHENPFEPRLDIQSPVFVAEHPASNNPFAAVAPEAMEPAVEPAAAPPPLLGDDFIAAARRAAQAASAPKSILTGISPTVAKISEDSSKKLWQRLPFPRRKEKTPGVAFVAGPKAVPEIKQLKGASGSRRKLLVMGLLLLAAVSAFTANMMGSAKVKSPIAPVVIESTVTPEASPTAVAPAPVESDAQGTAVPPQPKPAELDGNMEAPPPASNTQSSIKADDDILTGSLSSSQTNQTIGSLVAGLAEELPAIGIGTQALREAAANGDAGAQFIVATRYLDGDAVKQDYSAAAKWYALAAKSGSAPAQYRLATLFERGKGVPQDNLEALKLYEQSGLQGNIKAMHNAAVIATGSSIGKPDYDKAIMWFSKAAEFGLKDSQYNLAVLLERGLGTRPNMEQALFWYMQAASQADDDASKRAEALTQSLSPAKVDMAKSMMKSWQAKKAPDAANIVAVSDASWQSVSGQNVQSKSPEDGSLVGQTQSLLTKLGFNVGQPDGQFGTKTANAIRLFQLQSGLKVTGTVSPELLAALQEKMG